MSNVAKIILTAIGVLTYLFAFLCWVAIWVTRRVIGCPEVGSEPWVPPESRYERLWRNEP